MRASGVFLGASLVFFAYIGFDAVSTAAQESKNPIRDLPIGYPWVPILGVLTTVALMCFLPLET
jgi:APA family basic amino acid/polyamine antiporter